MLPFPAANLLKFADNGKNMGKNLQEKKKKLEIE
jgi:hypothetical protein